MPFTITDAKRFVYGLKNIFFIVAALSSCTTVRNYQKDKPFVYKNNIEVVGGKFSASERSALKQRLNAQLVDSARVKTKDILFVIHKIKTPPVYDSAYAELSARNMKGSMLHLGYYNAIVTYKAGVWKRKTTGLNALLSPFGNLLDAIFRPKLRKLRVATTYTVAVGNPTLIDTVSYLLKKPELQQLAMSNIGESYLVKGTPVTKSGVLGEVGRLVVLYRNNGYYKFTSDDLKVRGDTSIAALTTISDDPFENLRLLSEANEKRNKPTIKLAVVLNPAADSNRLKKYYINDIYIYPDYLETDAGKHASFIEDTTRAKYYVRYHKKLFRNGFLARNIYFKKDSVYRQEDYAKTINSFSKKGVWQSVNILVVEPKDSNNKVDMIVQMIPAKKYGFEANIETSYSSNNTTTTAGNLFGISGNLSLQNRNVRKEAIKMTNALRAGVEFNLGSRRNQNSRLINSNELSFTNSFEIPRFVFPFKKLKWPSQQSFVSTNLSYVNRIDLFNLQSVGVALGYEGSKRPIKEKLSFKILNLEFSYLYNQSDSFKKTLDKNPYLRYSFNTALVMGLSFGYTTSGINAKHTNRSHVLKANLEESGLTWGSLGFFQRYMRKFIKTDFEYTYTASHTKSAFVAHGFLGVGIPIGRSDSSLPFFKQYYGGGANSMRGWPIRGIGRGAQPQLTYDDNTTAFNDRTGDIKIEANAEYRFDILAIIPNSVTLKGVFFVDAGNIWNFRKTTPDGIKDSLQFRFKDLYKQLGVTAGTGFRIDFGYFMIRLDLGFRVKRPDIAKNYGWQFPDITFNNLFKRGPNNEYKKWRYENFNFAFGISYPF